MPTGINKDGSPKKRPANSGKPPKPGAVAKTFRLSPAVISILETVPKQKRTDWVEDAIQDKYLNEKLKP